MEFQLEQGLEILERTPATLRALLGGLSEAWSRGDGNRETWDPYAVIGHLINGDEGDWLPRLETIMEHGPARPFEPVDRFAQFERFTEQPLDALLERFARVRGENVARLRAMQLSPGDLAREGTHPALGTVTLGNLLATWVAHDLNHIGQVAEAMARQYSDEVGPWKQFLDILTR